MENEQKNAEDLTKIISACMSTTVSGRKLRNLAETDLVAALLEKETDLLKFNESSLYLDAFRRVIGAKPKSASLSFTIDAAKFQAFKERININGVPADLRDYFDEALEDPLVDIPHTVFGATFAPHVDKTRIAEILDIFNLHVSYPHDLIGALYGMATEPQEDSWRLFKGDVFGGIVQTVRSFVNHESIPYIDANNFHMAIETAAPFTISAKPLTRSAGTCLLVCSCKH